MKIRSDFVTNSSSSSFVVAVKKDTTKEDLINIFSAEEHKATIEEVSEWFDYENYEDSRTEFINELARQALEILERKKYMVVDVGEFKIGSLEGGTDDIYEGGELGCFLYQSSRIDTDKLKTGSYN